MTKSKTNKEILTELAELTYNRCKTTCKCLGSCCSNEYCDIAADYAAEKGVTLESTGNKIRFLNSGGNCIVPPEFRPFCALHQCEINGLGFFKNDDNLTNKYFELRNSITEL